MIIFTLFVLIDVHRLTFVDPPFYRAVYMASGCASLAGKMVAVWFPISAFVALGFDHSVANMFITPLGMMRGAQVTTSDFLMKNLLPVTLGNIVGGALCVMGLYGSAFGNWFKSKEE